MNSTVRVEGAGQEVQDWFAEVEATLSRFDPRSSLSRLNALPERWVVVPPLLYRAVQAALEAARRTGGAFDPTVLSALEAAGYGRSFELGPTPVAPPVPAGRWPEVRLDQQLLAIWLPAGVRLDLGGIGKGLAVDGALERFAPGQRLLVNAGGDLALRTPPDTPPVTVEVEDPFDRERTLAIFSLHRGAVATSTSLGRRWSADLHHIIDPASGRPAHSGVVAATVVAAGAALAEVLAKACVVLGPEAGLALLARERCQGILVTEDGTTLFTPGMQVWLCQTAP